MTGGGALTNNRLHEIRDTLGLRHIIRIVDLEGYQQLELPCMYCVPT